MLTSKQRSYLTALSNKMPSGAALGKDGLTEAVLKHVGLELDRHELIKLRFSDFKEARRELAAELAERTGAELVRIVGNVALFYRRQADPEKRTIELPNG
jgi:RNA-binding protein